MKRMIFFVVFLMGIGILTAQEQSHIVNEGDVFILTTPTASGYQHLDFPRKNLIIKRGAIADFKSLAGKQLVVQNVTTKSDGSTETILRRKDGMKFFRFFPTVRADMENAILSGELKRNPIFGEDSVAQQ